MYSYNAVAHGVTTFIDRELLPKMKGLNKWLVGTASGIMATRGEHLFHELKEHAIIKSLGLIENDKINVTCIYNELIKQAARGPIDIEIPMIGTITLNHSDVEKLYHYITED